MPDPIVDPETGEILEREVLLFADWLTQQRSGGLALELDHGLNALAEAVRRLGKAGTLTLTVKLKPTGKGSERAVMVVDDVVVKEPVEERGASIWFVTDAGALSRSNPDQPRLPLREVPKRTPARTATEETGTA